MSKLKRIAVFCGASRGKDKVYMEQGYALGKYMAENGYTLVYGAGSVGVMGAISNGVLDNGGEAIGVMPKSLDDKEITSQRLTDLVLVDSLHGRKAKMSELADAFILAPGGAGSLEEFFETYSWAQIGIHDKPMAVFNINNFFEPLQQLIESMIEASFIDDKYRGLAPLYDNLDDLFDGLEHYRSVGTRTYD